MPQCSLEDCARPVVARGWCDSHYTKLRPRPTCSEEGCERPVKGRGICAAHAEKERRRRKGPPKHIFGERGPCTAEGCDRLVWSPGRVHCQMHYMRMRKNGTLVPKIVRGERGDCGVENCGDPVDTPGVPYCQIHQQRFRKHGDPLVTLVGGYKGDDVGYQGAHRRVHALRGKAVEHACVDCGEQAAHWSYDHADRDARICEVTGAPYSLDPDRYQPRCLSCHTRFDKGLSRPARAGSPAA